MILLNLIGAILNEFNSIESIEVMNKTDDVEIIGNYANYHTIVTVKYHSIPKLDKDHRGRYQAIIKDGKVTDDYEYILSKEEEKFIKQAYCFDHLSRRQISKISKIPQEAIYSLIKREKLVPVYSNEKMKMEKSNTYTCVQDFYKSNINKEKYKPHHKKRNSVEKPFYKNNTKRKGRK